MTWIKHKGDVYEVIEAGPWEAVIPAQLHSGEPLHRWSGGKIPLALVKQITSFFEWSYEETKSETVAHLFYNDDTGEWLVEVLPQKGHTGMSVTFIEDHPRRLEIVERMNQTGFLLAGTWHHHCSGAAFQSGTDKKDEEEILGLHVTIGKVGSKKYDIDARCSFRRHFTPAVLSDWIEVTGLLRLPFHLLEPIVEHMVCEPNKDMEFPPEWKENVIKVQTPIVTGGYGGNYVGGYKPPWQNSQGYTPGRGWDAWDHWEPADTLAQAKPEPPKKTVAEELKEIAQAWGLQLSEVCERLLHYRDDNLLTDVMEVMADHRITVEDVLEEADKEADKEWEQDMDEQIKRLEEMGGVG